VNLWMLGFDVQCSLLHRWSFVVLCCLLWELTQSFITLFALMNLTITTYQV
jgi:hypothetical protein